MKKMLTFLLAAVLIMPSFALADEVERVTLKEVDNKHRNAIFDMRDEEWLVHWRDCGNLEQGASINVVIDGNFDGRRDFFAPKPYQKCRIDQAKVINKRMTVYDLPRTGGEATLEDEDGELFRVSYSQACRRMFGFRNQTIYLNQFGNELKNGDKIYLPQRAGQCSILRLVRLNQPTGNNSLNTTVTVVDPADSARPSVVKRVRAFPGNGEVALFWNKASDNKAVSHYLVGYSTNELNIRNTRLEEMPNQTIVNGVKTTIKGLANDVVYYFYVMAVDSDGNTSSQWSNTATAEPKSSISRTGKVSSDEQSIHLRVFREDARFVNFVWEPPSDTLRTFVSFDGPDGRIRAMSNYRGRTFRIAKLKSRKNKPLSFTVRLFDIAGLTLEETVEFSY